MEMIKLLEQNKVDKDLLAKIKQLNENFSGGMQTIENEVQFENTINVYDGLKKMEKQALEPFAAKKKELYAPYKAAQQEEKIIKDYFSKVKSVVNKGITEWNNKRIAQIEEESDAPVTAVAPPKQKGIRQTVSYDIHLEDIKKVPMDYLLVNVDMIKAMLKHNPKLEVPGVKIVKRVKVG